MAWHKLIGGIGLGGYPASILVFTKIASLVHMSIAWNGASRELRYCFVAFYTTKMHIW